MNKKLAFILIASACLPSLAYADTYKCRQPNGSTAFQDRPCDKGAVGSTITLVPAQSYSAGDSVPPSDSSPSPSTQNPERQKAGAINAQVPPVQKPPH